MTSRDAHIFIVRIVVRVARVRLLDHDAPLDDGCRRHATPRDGRDGDARDVGARANGGAMRRRANERTSIAEGDDDDRERRTIERRGDADGDADDDANAGGGAGGSVRDRES